MTSRTFLIEGAKVPGGKAVGVKAVQPRVGEALKAKGLSAAVSGVPGGPRVQMIDLPGAHVIDTFVVVEAGAHQVVDNMTAGLRIPAHLSDKVGADLVGMLPQGNAPVHHVNIGKLFSTSSSIPVKLELARVGGERELLFHQDKRDPSLSRQRGVKESEGYLSEQPISELSGAYIVVTFPRMSVARGGWNGAVHVEVRMPADDVDLLSRELYSDGRGLDYLRYLAGEVADILAGAGEYLPTLKNRLDLNLTRDSAGFVRSAKGNIEMSLPLDRAVDLIGNEAANEHRVGELYKMALESSVGE